jgi:hypothetical protein
MVHQTGYKAKTGGHRYPINRDKSVKTDKKTVEIKINPVLNSKRLDID